MTPLWDLPETDVYPKYETITVRLTGMDGNIFSIMGRVNAALKNGGASASEVKLFNNNVTNSESYEVALIEIMRWVHVY